MIDFSSDLMSQLRKTVASRMLLPANQFFQPTVRYWEELKHLCKEANMPVRFIDCGAGSGHVMQEGRDRGFDIEAIDICRREDQHEDVLIGDACDIVWSATTWPLFCRPSHTGWANVVADNALRQGARVLWAGKPENFNRDGLGGYRAKIVARRVGIAGENLYELQRVARHQNL